jgi:hypothetical protein
MRIVRRKRDRQARELARLFVALDAAASSRRAWRPRPRVRLSLGSTR